MANNQLIESDSFTSGSLNAGWSAIEGLSESQIVSGTPNVAEPNTTSTEAGQQWSGITWPNDQISEATVGTFTQESGTTLTLRVRMQPGANSGYTADFTDGTVTISKITAGSKTTLTSKSYNNQGTGGVYGFMAAGGVLVVYEANNGFPNPLIIIATVSDPTYTSGVPGFSQTSSVAIAHMQVRAWRGYSAVQQDGVWQKQGIAIPLNTADGSSGNNGCGVLYEGNPKILSADNVFKMWFGEGYTNGVGYAESLDGINWTRYSSLVITGPGQNTLFKYAGTYYVYCSTAQGAIQCYTSTDGLTFTLQNSSAISTGTSGAWDSESVYGLTVLAVISGTWYALYAGASVSDGVFSSGLATSSDGINWTKYASNPVLSDYFPAGAATYLGGTAYVWACSALQGMGQATDAVALTDPTEGTRFSSSYPFTSWTLSAKSVHHSQLFESLNTITGQAAPVSILSVGNKTYLYLISSPLDVGPDSMYQTSVATAPGTLSNVVQFPENAVDYLATDAFERSSGGLGANWTTPSGGTALTIASSGVVEASVTSTYCLAAYTGVTFNDSHRSDIVIGAIASGCYVGPAVCCKTGADTCYGVIVAGAAGSAQEAFIFTLIAGVATSVAEVSITPNVGDTLSLQVTQGADGFNILQFFQNGFLVYTYIDYSNAVSFAGSPGMIIYASTLADAQISSFVGGNANIIPHYVSVWSPPDCRNYGSFPLTPVTVQGSAIYALDPNSDNSKLPPTDSRKTKPVDCRVASIVPENSRVNPNPNA